MITFISIMSGLITAGLITSIYFFRKGGTYNPHEPESTDGGTIYVPEVTKTPEIVPPQPSPREMLYIIAKANIGQKLTINPLISPEVRCAQALSKILFLADYKLPNGGISTVKNMIQWCIDNGFQETQTPVHGCIITASGNPNYSHCGVVMKYGICSNDSRPEYLGKWMENYSSTAAWKAFYDVHNSKTRYFIPV